jgi:hypothetical protein
MLPHIYPPHDPRRPPLAFFQTANDQFHMRGGELGGYVVSLTEGWSVFPSMYLTEESVFRLESVPGVLTEIVTIQYLRDPNNLATFRVRPRTFPPTLTATMGARVAYPPLTDDAPPEFRQISAGFNEMTLIAAGGAGYHGFPRGAGGGGGQVHKYLLYAHERSIALIHPGRPGPVGGIKDGNVDTVVLIHGRLFRTTGGSPATFAAPGAGGGALATTGSGGGGGDASIADRCGGGGAGGVVGYGGDVMIGSGDGFADGASAGRDSSLSGGGYGLYVRPTYPNYGWCPTDGESVRIEEEPIRKAFPGRYGGGGCGNDVFPAMSGAPGAVLLTSQQRMANK